MGQGTLEVLLVSAKGLDNTDFLTNIDPYVVLTCRSQEKKSSIASGQGTSPEWNETFLFSIAPGTSELVMKIYDSDNVSEDDLVGEAKIPLEPVLHSGSVEPTSYSVVKDGEYCGEVKVGLLFTQESSRGFDGDNENFGGWAQSSRD